MTAEQQVLQEIERSARLRPADVRDARFATTFGRGGYDQNDVDVFLDQVEAALAPDLAALGRLRPSQLTDEEFGVTVLRRGYVQDEVDEFVALVRDELARRWNIAARELGSAWNDPG